MTGVLVTWISGDTDFWWHGFLVTRISGDADFWCGDTDFKRIFGAMDLATDFLVFLLCFGWPRICARISVGFYVARKCVRGVRFERPKIS